jgi:hypothetical protein
MGLRTGAPVIKKIIWLVMFVPLVGFCQAPVGTYSSLRYNPESGDLNGYELTFIPTDSGVKTVVQIAEDGINEVHLASVNSTRGTLKFSVAVDDGSKVEFTMKCSTSHCRGTYKWQKANVKINLEKRPSYWSRQKSP